MTRFLRHFTTLLCAGSLLLFLAVCVLWIRSYRHTDRFAHNAAGGYSGVYSREGALVLYVLRANWSNRPADSFGFKYETEQPAPPSVDILTTKLLCTDSGVTESSYEYGTFAWWRRSRTDGVLYLMIIAPFWSLGAVSTAAPLALLALRLRRRRRVRAVMVAASAQSAATICEPHPSVARNVDRLTRQSTMPSLGRKSSRPLHDKPFFFAYNHPSPCGRSAWVSICYGSPVLRGGWRFIQKLATQNQGSG